MTIRVGIVGCGSIAEYRHAPEYAANPEVELVALYDPNRSRAELLSRLYGAQVMDSFDEITRNPGIDAISDCSTNEMHPIITTDALEHGKHVLCEKPIATTLEGARRMVTASRANKKILMIAHNQRFAPAHKKAKEILQSGELGRVLTFRTTFGHPGPEYWSENRTKGTWFFSKNRQVLGVAGDLGMHKIDLLRYLLSDEIDEVWGFSETLDKKLEDGQPIPVSDNMISLVKTCQGIIGTVTVSWTYYGPEDNSTILYCEKGVMKLYADPVYQVRVEKPGGLETLYRLGAIQTNESQSNSGVIDAFIDCIRAGHPPLVSGEDGLLGLQTVLAVIESSQRGVKIKVADQV